MAAYGMHLGPGMDAKARWAGAPAVALALALVVPACGGLQGLGPNTAAARAIPWQVQLAAGQSPSQAILDQVTLVRRRVEEKLGPGAVVTYDAETFTISVSAKLPQEGGGTEVTQADIALFAQPLPPEGDLRHMTIVPRVSVTTFVIKDGVRWTAPDDYKAQKVLRDIQEALEPSPVTPSVRPPS